MQIVPSTCLVRSELLRWEELFNSGDARGLAALHAEDSVLMLPDHRMIRGRSEIAGYWSEVRNRGGDHVRLQINEVDVGKNVGVAAGTALLSTARDGGRSNTCEVSFGVTWKLPGSVLAVVLHSRRPAGTPSSDERQQRPSETKWRSRPFDRAWSAIGLAPFLGANP